MIYIALLRNFQKYSDDIFRNICNNFGLLHVQCASDLTGKSGKTNKHVIVDAHVFVGDAYGGNRTKLSSDFDEF